MSSEGKDCPDCESINCRKTVRGRPICPFCTKEAPLPDDVEAARSHIRNLIALNLNDRAKQLLDEAEQRGLEVGDLTDELQNREAQEQKNQQSRAQIAEEKKRQAQELLRARRDKIKRTYQGTYERVLEQFRERKYLYHCTALENLPSILEHGIVSRNAIGNGQITFRDTSNQEVQKLRSKKDVFGRELNLHDYVPLFFTDDTPTIHVMRKVCPCCVLCVSADIVDKASEYVFTDGNAASKYTTFFTDMRDLQKLDLITIDGQQDPREFIFNDVMKRKKQAEFLVKGRVPPDLIKKILVERIYARRVNEIVTDASISVKVINNP